MEQRTAHWQEIDTWLGDPTRLIKITRQLSQKLGREPSVEEIASEMAMPADRARELLNHVVAISTPVDKPATHDAWWRTTDASLPDWWPTDDDDNSSRFYLGEEEEERQRAAARAKAEAESRIWDDRKARAGLDARLFARQLATATKPETKRQLHSKFKAATAMHADYVCRACQQDLGRSLRGRESTKTDYAEAMRQLRLAISRSGKLTIVCNACLERLQELSEPDSEELSAFFSTKFAGSESAPACRYTCKVCGLAFVRKRRLNQSFVDRHGGPTCPKCARKP